ANYAISYEKKGTMEAKGNVVLINEIGEKLNTEYLIWNQKEAKIFSDKFVKITTKDEIIMGEGFESNESFTNFKIHHIKGTILVEN
ncbi:MAG TPA: LPS export ABC transporter periplasmic protein LptC, partial [Flavobacteriales bacterium]|nr:LPS export ABC transporter periplasmic protein LptC [Flavobacteriales bacterium]